MRQTHIKNPLLELVEDQLVSWRPARELDSIMIMLNSTSLSSSRAGCRPAREPAHELRSVMEFGLYNAKSIETTIEPTLLLWGGANVRHLQFLEG